MTFRPDAYDEQDFDHDFLAFCRRALEIAGIETDARLKDSKPIRHDIVHAISEQGFHYRSAAEVVPTSSAHWELSEFLKRAVRPALWDLSNGYVRNYAQFDYLYRRIWGERSRRYLPMVFSAAAWAPGLCDDAASALLATMPDRNSKLFED